jgi:hypothetical protein
MPGRKKREDIGCGVAVVANRQATLGGVYGVCIGRVVAEAMLPN